MNAAGFVLLIGSVQPVLGVNLSDLVFLPDNYDFQTIPPTPLGGPLMVNYSIFLGGILAIDEPTQSISIECILRSHWQDPRIQTTMNQSGNMDYVILNRNPTSLIWFPDVYVDSAKSIEVPAYVLTPEYLRIYPDKTLLYALKITLDLSCPMDFSNYPVDTQHCYVLFESWSTVMTLIKFGWNETGSRIRENLNLNQHYLEVDLCGKEMVFYETGKLRRTPPSMDR
ncbi:hypothetical protein TCAL_14758 [Tigriopus californicus]|uniref:Neurotransmitter-gated ion-channel ligand-binding domain-containing protein n=1 Tax=Tigriopus californicus TaxID=6832 RepID=A0A553PES6_TIGCA|nr:glycine receptor subunit alpha-2-like [Tigriopus californicus]TRY76189.1 hypothetical protein TCAL_14758 [Tigriopus californicus]